MTIADLLATTSQAAIMCRLNGRAVAAMLLGIEVRNWALGLRAPTKTKGDKT